VKFFEGICKAGRDVGGRLTVQPLRLDELGTAGRIPRGPEWQTEMVKSIAASIKYLRCPPLSWQARYLFGEELESAATSACMRLGLFGSATGLHLSDFLPPR
jgi:hypothetical protein